jgi:hypothetical protein
LRNIHTLSPLTSVINPNLNIDIGIDLSAYYNITQVDALLTTKQNLLTLGVVVPINVGRGVLQIENNIYDNADGAGLTLRTLTNPVDGAIFAIRSKGQGCRLWVGQSLCSSGQIAFCTGYVGTTQSDYHLESSYKRIFKDTSCNLGTNTSITGDLTVSGIINGYYNSIQVDALLTHYYDKPETDLLLDGKQDKLINNGFTGITILDEPDNL